MPLFEIEGPSIFNSYLQESVKISRLVIQDFSDNGYHKFAYFSVCSRASVVLV